jgi:four helix bundle protein
MTSQLRRAAIAVPSNIAEGFGRGSTRDYARFLKIARGSHFEIDTQLLFALELGYITRESYDTLFKDWTDVSKVLAGLIRSIEPTDPLD